MKKDNRGFMLAEVIIVSSIVVTVLVTMYTGLNKLFVKYDELSRYYNVDAIYMAKNVEDYLIDSYQMGSVIGNSSSVGYVDLRDGGYFNNAENLISNDVVKLYFIGNYGEYGDGYDKVKNLSTSDKYFDDYASDALKSYVKSGGEELQKCITNEDGELMAIPAPNLTAGGVNEMWIRQDWLDALGLDVPRTWDELAEVAKAFVTRDPDGNGENDTIGILGPGNSDHMNAVGGNQFGLDPLFSCFQSYPQYWLKSEDGSVEYGSIQPETKTALENISKLYADGVIDPETLVRSDSKEPLLAGKVGIFFGPWWCAYTFADTTLSGSADWRAYFTPLSEDGKYYTHMAEPTTQYVVASKDCKNPEAAFKIINYLIAYEQTWVEEGVTSTEMGTADFYPLYNAYDNADEIETSFETLTKYLAGGISMDDVDFSTHKLLKNDMEAVTELKKKPYDDFSLKYWNLDSDLAKGNLPRLIAIMVGDAPLVNEEYVPVYNAYNGQTETMEAKWANLKKMEEETFAKIIMGKADISEFDTFVKNWKNQGGDQILKEINDELSK